MSDIKTPEDVIAWFTQDRPNGPPTHRREDIELLVTGMLTRPDPLYPDREEFLTPGMMWNQVYNYGYMYDGSYSGWITREGRILGASYAAHEKLLYWLGVDTKVAEAAGWCRYSRQRGYQCLFRLSLPQKRILKAQGHIVDSGAERMKPVWNGNPIKLGE
jgi:hypothetical protein